MIIVYVSPVDGLPRARKTTSYREAGRVIQALEEMGCDPTACQIEDLLDAKETSLPLFA